jgi:predicted Holliday junction resolvase-like endonuclease
MTVELSFIAIAIICGIAGLVLLVFGIRLGMFIGRLKTERSFAGRVEAERNDAVKRSRSVLNGQFSEQLAPFLPDFPGDPTEVRFIGKPVDFIFFSGASRGEIDEVVFIEVKTGEGSLSPVEKSLKKAIDKGRIRYVEYRVPR